MQTSKTRDLVVGVFVLVGLAAIGYLSVQVGGLSYKGPGGLRVKAAFDEIGGLSVRAPVVISGVKIGQVSRIELDSDLRALVTLELDATLELPVDSTASVRSAGLLGDQLIAITPGAEDALLASGDVIAFTESAFNIEKLVGRLVTSFDGGKE